MTEFESKDPQGRAAPAKTLPPPQPAAPAPGSGPAGKTPPADAGEDPGAAPPEGPPPANALPDLPCEACRDLIPLVQDGAASDASVQLVAQHIAHCRDCRAFWQAGAPAAAPDDGKVLSRIHRRLRLVLAAALAAGALVAFWLNTYAYRLEYSVVILPVVGALGCLLLRRRWYFAPPAVAALGFVWHLVATDGWQEPLVFAVGYGLLCLLGALAAKLFVYAFGKGD